MLFAVICMFVWFVWCSILVFFHSLSQKPPFCATYEAWSVTRGYAIFIQVFYVVKPLVPEHGSYTFDTRTSLGRAVTNVGITCGPTHLHVIYLSTYHFLNVKNTCNKILLNFNQHFELHFAAQSTFRHISPIIYISYFRQTRIIWYKFVNVLYFCIF